MPLRDETLALHGGLDHPPSGPLEAPIVQSVAYRFADAEDARLQFEGARAGNIYSRWRNPNASSLEQKLSALESAEDTVVFASGIAAIAGSLLACVESGARIVAQRGLYAETARFMREVLPRFGVHTEYVDATSLPDVTQAISEKECRILYIETPANPNLALADISALSALAHSKNTLLFVDSTFASPALQKPLELGAHLVLHSATKLLAGHGDVLAGVAAGNRTLIASIRKESVRTMGAALAPASAALVERGLSTLYVRVARASESALELARRLSEHPAVARVHYPGLPSHPQHTLACRQMRGGFGPVLSFELQRGYEGGVRLYDRVQIISRAVSLGDVRSLITHPASTTSASLPREQRSASGISDGLLRLSVGLEHVEDLWDDLARALV